jgi:hypothetical protein
VAEGQRNRSDWSLYGTITGFGWRFYWHAWEYSHARTHAHAVLSHDKNIWTIFLCVFLSIHTDVVASHLGFLLFIIISPFNNNSFSYLQVFCIYIAMLQQHIITNGTVNSVTVYWRSDIIPTLNLCSVKLEIRICCYEDRTWASLPQLGFVTVCGMLNMQRNIKTSTPYLWFYYAWRLWCLAEGDQISLLQNQRVPISDSLFKQTESILKSKMMSL